MIPAIAVLAMVAMTILLGTLGLRYARTTSNFFVASRSVHPVWNAFAVCGEAMSAASYLGAPALILVFGVDMLWPIAGWTVGFFLLNLFIAAPVRRFGSYTIPEFAEGRLDAPGLRPIVAVMVILASWFFLLAQLKGAGVIVRSLMGVPYWVGVVAVAVLVAINLSSGGMRGITFVQGFQFFFIVFGIILPFVVMTVSWMNGGFEPIITDEFPTFAQTTAVEYPTDIVVSMAEPATVTIAGQVDDVVSAGSRVLRVGDHTISSGTTITWPAGTLAPHAEGIQPLTGEQWSQPIGDKDLAGGHPLYHSFATFLANMMGLIALPHIVVRFYTNPTGREARQTALWVLVMIVPYYAMLPFFGAIGRVLSPDLLGTGAVDSLTVSVGERLGSGLAGELITAAVAAGAVAAFLSTSSGLLIAMAGAVSHDMMKAGVPQFRSAVWAGALASMVIGVLIESINISVLIGWSTSIAASSICPLLVLGIWWEGLTRRGATAAVVVGGTAATTSAFISMSGIFAGGWPLAILLTPAVWTVPLAFSIGWFVSVRDVDKVADVGHKFALLHLPERVTPALSEESA